MPTQTRASSSRAQSNWGKLKSHLHPQVFNSKIDDIEQRLRSSVSQGTLTRDQVKKGRITKAQAAEARAVLALVLMKGGASRYQNPKKRKTLNSAKSRTYDEIQSQSGKLDNAQFWTNYGAGAKDVAQANAREQGVGGTVEMTEGGGWLDSSIPFDKLSERAGGEGAKYIWDMISADFARSAKEATFSVARGDTPHPEKTWKAIEEPILQSKNVPITENRF